MAGRKPGEPSPESIARTHRQRIAAEQGKQAMADVERRAVAVRENMARLRALREAADARREALPDQHGALAVKSRKRQPTSRPRRRPVA
ncbi:transcriptional regulator [Bradyrhizobium sp. CCBAU 051011]|nr:transcriptional regulator [Bradyrhizobium sp. CCBAU 051011]QHO74171.1 transcriptional regulator [Bradyrhizobium sp. CCBAU 051011]